MGGEKTIQELFKVARLNKRLAKKEEGSNNWYKAKHKLARVHEKVANIRKDFLHKLSTKLICENQTIVVDRELIKIDTFFSSSQLCSECGYKNKEVKDLSIRKWKCPECGALHDRDINASKNILQQGLQLQLDSR